MKLLSVFLILFSITSGVFAQNDKPVVVLKGFDAVALVQKKQIREKKTFS